MLTSAGRGEATLPSPQRETGGGVAPLTKFSLVTACWQQ
jgi:hypothetical protein